MIFPWGNRKRYNDFSTHLIKEFNGKVQKISVNAGFTCPNRDGAKGVGGCTFCNNDSFKPDYCKAGVSITEQLKRGIEIFRRRHPEAEYLAYFQSYTNTYGHTEALKKLYEEALSCSGVRGLIIGTRPDCFSDDLLNYLEKLSQKTYLVIELGIESTSNSTLENINRGHNFECTCQTIAKLAERGILTGAHLILGLPGETRQQMLAHAKILSSLPIKFLKMHQLQYLKGSVIGNQYMKNPKRFHVFELDEYIELVVDFIERTSPKIIFERFASQSPYELLLAPGWKIKNFEFVHKIDKRLEERNTWQGKLWED